MATITTLPTAFPSRYDVPVIAHVDLGVFTRQYFTDCMACTFCGDSCCSHGVDVDLHHVQCLLERGDALEAYTGIGRDNWFVRDRIEDPELPGGGSVRTQVAGGACVFLDRRDRGCMIHKFCDEFGTDYHELKSIVDCLFPLAVTDDTLYPASEAEDGTLACVGTGPTLYRGLRGELEYYFGPALVETLDGLEGSAGQ